MSTRKNTRKNAIGIDEKAISPTFKYSVYLDKEDHDILYYLAKHVYETTMSNVIRMSIRHFFAYTIMSEHAHDILRWILTMKTRELGIDNEPKS